MTSATLLPRPWPPRFSHPARLAPPSSLDSIGGFAAITQCQARHEFSLLENWLFAASTLGLPLHQVESQEQARARPLLRLLLQAHVQQRGDGGVGLALGVQGSAGQSRYTHRRVRKRQVKTLFGPIKIVRMGYGRPGAASIYPLDAALQLPARSFSYELQRHMVLAAVQGPFQETIERLVEISGCSVPKRSIEEVVRDAAQDFDVFYAQRTHPMATETGPILVAAVDGKGIPLVKPGGAPRVIRPVKGWKTNRKKMATVATVFTRQPWVRTPEEVIESLFALHPPARTEEPARPRPEHKRVWASLVKGKAAVIDEVAQEMRRRDPQGLKQRVALTDGERVLQSLVSDKLGVTLILDLLHAMEKLWKAAYCFHPEGTLEAELWVRQRALRLLRGQVGQVVKGLRQSATKMRLCGAKGKTVRNVADYLYRNRHRMRYDQYLAQGLPIASGPVEGACKNLIKDRMERSGMRWTEAMAEAIVKLRAVYLSGDFDAYWRFHIEQDQERLHPRGHWTVVQK